MSKDYANTAMNRQVLRADGTLGPKRAGSNRQRLGALLLILGIVIVLAGYLIHQDFRGLKAKVTGVLSEQSVTVTPKIPPKPSFEFYTELPNGQSTLVHRKLAERHHHHHPKHHQRQPTVKLDRDVPAVETLPAKPTVQSGQYMLQVGSFRLPKDADKLKASLTLQGYNVVISRFKTDNYTWYRVKLGPYPSLHKAKAVRTDLALANIDSMLRRIA